MFRTSWLRVLIASVIAVPALGCGASEQHGSVRASDEIVSAETRVAEVETIPETIEATGSVEPWTRASPGTKLMGRIDEVGVREGDRVARDALLARLERRDLEAAVAQARAAIGMAEADLDNAGAQFKRMQLLHERGSTTDKSLEDATTRFRVATATLEQARANLAAAEVTLDYAEVRSPIAGRIASKLAEVGDMTRPGMPLFVVEDLSRVKIHVHVAEADVIALRRGDAARIGVDVFEDFWDAEIARILPAGDPASRTFEVQLVLTNADGRLKSGMFARARFARGTRPALLVPAGALVERGQLQGLYVIDPEGRARLRWVRLGRVVGNRVEVLSGLAAGERYVISPPGRLTDGARVERG